MVGRRGGDSKPKSAQDQIYILPTGEHKNFPLVQVENRLPRFDFLRDDVSTFNKERLRARGIDIQSTTDDEEPCSSSEDDDDLRAERPNTVITAAPKMPGGYHRTPRPTADLLAKEAQPPHRPALITKANPNSAMHGEPPIISPRIQPSSSITPEEPSAEGSEPPVIAVSTGPVVGATDVDTPRASATTSVQAGDQINRFSGRHPALESLFSGKPIPHSTTDPKTDPLGSVSSTRPQLQGTANINPKIQHDGNPFGLAPLGEGFQDLRGHHRVGLGGYDVAAAPVPPASPRITTGDQERLAQGPGYYPTAHQPTASIEYRPPLVNAQYSQQAPIPNRKSQKARRLREPDPVESDFSDPPRESVSRGERRQSQPHDRAYSDESDGASRSHGTMRQRSAPSVSRRRYRSRSPTYAENARNNSKVDGPRRKTTRKSAPPHQSTGRRYTLVEVPESSSSEPELTVAHPHSRTSDLIKTSRHAPQSSKTTSQVPIRKLEQAEEDVYQIPPDSASAVVHNWVGTLPSGERIPLVVVEKRRGFVKLAPQGMRWFNSSCDGSLVTPPVERPIAGDLYFHKNTQPDGHSLQVWMFQGVLAGWFDITARWDKLDGSLKHPLLHDKFLSTQAVSGEPSYVSKATLAKRLREENEVANLHVSASISRAGSMVNRRG